MIDFRALFKLADDDLDEEMRQVLRSDNEEYLINFKHRDKIADKEDVYERIRGC